MLVAARQRGKGLQTPNARLVAHLVHGRAAIFQKNQGSRNSFPENHQSEP
jgi:hypothetical protein